MMGTPKMPRIVHLGLGNFHRAHQAWYTAHSDGWNITGVIMSNHKLRDQLAAHDNKYVLGIWGKDGLRTETISVYDDVLLATEQPSDVIAKIADPQTQVVTLTMTEKGYYLRSEDGRLDLASESIIRDLTCPEPRSAIGLLAAGLISRMDNGAGVLTVLSCDNLANNGCKLRQAMADYMTEKDPGSVEWLLKHVSFPNSMVDRITPKLTDAAVLEIANSAGQNAMPVVGTEAFSEWVIEDQFSGARPEWDAAGAVFVKEVAPFEERKLRLLNSSHSFLAYAGQLAGHRFVHEAIADPTLLAGVNALWDEAATTVSKPAADTLQQYRSALLDRFAVPELRHELSQIAMDGSLKLRERLVPILEFRADADLHSPHTCTAIAAWMEFVNKAVEAGINLDDPHADQIADIVLNTRDVAQIWEKLAQLVGLSSKLLPQFLKCVTKSC